jgi:hypothetical protein
MTMGIRFKVKASDLNEAIDIAAIVPPRPFDKNNTSGYLFVIRGDRGYVYSNDHLHTTRADFPLLEVEGEGAFIYPGVNIKAFTFFKNMIDFEVKNGEEEGSEFSITYDGGNGAGKAPRPLFNPKFMQACDKELDAATDERTFSAGLLREALNLSKSFHGGGNQKGDDDHFKVVQVFDKNKEVDDTANPGKKLKPFEHGDGFLFASDKVRTLHFQSDGLMGKHLTVHATHMPLLQAFLAKSSGKVRILTGTNKTFAVDERGRVFGWAHTVKSHSKFSFSSGTKGVDAAITLKISKFDMLNALKYMKEELETGRDKIRVLFNADNKTIQFQIAEGKGLGLSSMYVEAPVDETQTTNLKDFGISVNITYLMGLFEEAKGNVVSMRVSVMDPDPNKGRTKQNGLLRTFDDFILDADGKVVEGGKLPEGASTCKVTRYAPSYVE